MVYVTHDQIEAMTLADRIVVLNAGLIEQVGKPMELYEHPANMFVAEFIGSPKMNLIPVELLEGTAAGATVRTGTGETLRVAVNAARGEAGDKVTLGIRPEHLGLTGPGGTLTATVRFVETLGHVTYAYVICGETSLTVQLPGEIRPGVGDALTLRIPPRQAHLFDSGGHAFSRL